MKKYIIPISHVLSLFLGLVLLVAAFSKISNLHEFWTSLNDLKIFPRAIVSSAVIIVPGAELMLGVCLLLRWSLPETALSVAGLMLLFFAYSIFINATMQHTTCDCFKGKASFMQVEGWWITVRDGVFLTISLLNFLVMRHNSVTAD